MLRLHLQQPAVGGQGIPQSAPALVADRLQLQDPYVLRVGGQQHGKVAGGGVRGAELQQGHRQIEARVSGIRLQFQAALEVVGSLLRLAQIQVAGAEMKVLRGELRATHVGGATGE